MKSSFAASFAARLASTPKSAQPRPGSSPLSYLRRVTLGALFLGGTLLASPAVAQQPVTIDKVKEDVFRVRTQNLTRQQGQVQVYSSITGQKLFDETFDQPYYSCHLNFKKLQPGNYMLYLKIGKDSYRYALQVLSDGTNEKVAVRSVKVKLRKQSQQIAALNTVVPVVRTSALAANGSGL